MYGYVQPVDPYWVFDVIPQRVYTYGERELEGVGFVLYTDG